MIRVIVADDDPRVRDDFGTLLGLEPDIDLLGTASDGREALELARRLGPQVVVLDVRMPKLDGIETTRHLRAAGDPAPRVLVVTTFDLDDYVLGAVRAGASGFLLKDRAPESLAVAVRTVAAGDAIFAPRATARLIQELVRPVSVESATGLTHREVDIVRFVALGRSNDEVAVLAGIARSTVKTHLSNILFKLGLSSRLQVVVWAYEHGVTPGGRGA